jgi:hypothetical protein
VIIKNSHKAVEFRNPTVHRCTLKNLKRNICMSIQCLSSCPLSASQLLCQLVDAFLSTTTNQSAYYHFVGIFACHCARVPLKRRLPVLRDIRVTQHKSMKPTGFVRLVGTVVNARRDRTQQIGSRRLASNEQFPSQPFQHVLVFLQRVADNTSKLKIVFFDIVKVYRFIFGNDQ